MESVHLNIPEESSTVLVCVLITAGTLEDRVNVTLKTYPITGILFQNKFKHILKLILFLQQLMEKITLAVNLYFPFHLDNLCLEIIHSALTSSSSMTIY